MAKRTRWGILSVLMTCSVAGAQVLSRSNEGFAQAMAPREWRFPRDHGKHAEFQTEWWYYTGNLRSAEGRRFGYQLTFFRSALLPEPPQRASRWAFRDGYVAHFTITDVEKGKFYYDQRMSRGALQLAEASEESLAVHIGSWFARGNAVMQLSAESEFGAIALRLENDRPPVLHGENGFARKGVQPGEASFYYSLPHLKARGRLVLGADTFAVVGTSWMDHEFFTGPEQSEVAGWDWFSLHLSDSTAVMLYLLRSAEGTVSSYSGGSFIAADGSTSKLSFGQFEATPQKRWRSAATGAQYPLEWRLKFAHYELLVSTPVAEQELDTRMTTGVIYWEGYVEVQGRKGAAQNITGAGYLEMTGYASRVEFAPIE